MSSYFTRGNFKTVNQSSRIFGEKQMKRYENVRYARKETASYNSDTHNSSWISKNLAKRTNKLRFDKSRYVYTRSA